MHAFDRQTDKHLLVYSSIPCSAEKKQSAVEFSWNRFETLKHITSVFLGIV